MKSNDSTFRIEYPEGDELLNRLMAIFAKNGEHKEIDHLRWQYVNNDGGGAYSAFAVSPTGEDAAVYSLFRFRAMFGGVSMVACQSLDTLTDKEYRGQGLFSILAKNINEKCDKENISFIYGFPNDKSAPIFFRKLQWECVGTPPFLLRVNNIGYIMKRLTGWNVRFPSMVSRGVQYIINYIRKGAFGYEIREGNDFISDYDLLWNSFSADLKNAVIRDAKYFKWRYFDRPNSDYRYISIYSGDKLCATAVYVFRNKHGGRIGYIMDVVFLSGHGTAASLAVGEAMARLYAESVDIVLAWSPHRAKTRSAYLANLFLPLPRRLQPIKLFVGMRYRPPSEQVFGHDLFLSYADSDTV